MKRQIQSIVLCGLALAVNQVSAMGNDNPLVFKAMLHELEQGEVNGSDETIQTWDAELWLGYDLQKWWLLSHGEAEEGEYESSRQELRYARAFSTFWDYFVSVRIDDYRHQDNTEWLGIGIQGLAPYYFDTDLALYSDGDGHSQLVLESEYEWMLTQRWVLVPSAELVANGSDRPQYAEQSGFSKAELGLRLRYEWEPEIGPYLGVQHERSLGDTAQERRSTGEHTESTRWVMGISAWF